MYARDNLPKTGDINKYRVGSIYPKNRLSSDKTIVCNENRSIFINFIFFNNNLEKNLKSVDFYLHTDCFFGMNSIMEFASPGMLSEQISDSYVLSARSDDFSECDLVMCNSGNLILKGYDKSKSEWKLMWAINDRDVNDC